MDYTVLITMVVKAIVGIAVVVMAPQLKAWLQEKVGQQKYDNIACYVDSFVKAAEQTIKKDDDPTGTLRKEYVIDLMQNIGIDVNETTNAIIEGCVLGLKKGA